MKGYEIVYLNRQERRKRCWRSVLLSSLLNKKKSNGFIIMTDFLMANPGYTFVAIDQCTFSKYLKRVWKD